MILLILLWLTAPVYADLNCHNTCREETEVVKQVNGEYEIHKTDKILCEGYLPDNCKEDESK